VFIYCQVILFSLSECRVRMLQTLDVHSNGRTPNEYLDGVNFWSPCSVSIWFLDVSLGTAAGFWYSWQLQCFKLAQHRSRWIFVRFCAALMQHWYQPPELKLMMGYNCPSLLRASFSTDCICGMKSNVLSNVTSRYLTSCLQRLFAQGIDLRNNWSYRAWGRT
jgi:hypothetical protein